MARNRINPAKTTLQGLYDGMMVDARLLLVLIALVKNEHTSFYQDVTNNELQGIQFTLELASLLSPL